jgi:16S rRNA processing protein RimM
LGDVPPHSKGEEQIRAIGKVTRPHGILGELKVQLAPQYAGALDGIRRVYLNDEPQARRVRGMREHQGALLLKLDGVSTRNDAEAWRGAIISIRLVDLPRLPEGEYYSHQLVGLRVQREGGEPMGTLSEVLATGSNDVYVVKTATGELLLPALESVVRSVDLEAGVMVVVVPDGLEPDDADDADDEEKGDRVNE